MQIKFFESLDYNKFIDFNKQIFPERINSQSIIDFWFNKSKTESALSIILKGDNEEIWGQNIHSSMFYYLENEKVYGEWGFDYIVREDKRKDGYGIDILQFALKHKDTIFAVGSGPLALKIELKMGFKLLGELKKYVSIANPFWLSTSIFRGIIPIKKFPLDVNIKGVKYILTTEHNLLDFCKPFNRNLLEFGRDKAFLNWRYFSGLHEYALYKKADGEDYFVLRTIVLKRITCLVLVDYRCDFSNPEDFESQIEVVKKVAGKLKLAIIITGSSLHIIDKILGKKYFKSIGPPRPIISSREFKEKSENIINREFIFSTLADSDGEILW
ncbi:MAG: hypothetical protein AB2L24_13445 [Mangrovibacterium sp.]